MRLFPDYVTTTSPQGARFVAAADWSPLKGRRVIVAPDYDGDWERFGEEVSNQAYGAGATEVLILRAGSIARYAWVDGLKLRRKSVPSGWDLDEAAADGWTPELISAAIAEPGVLEFAPRSLVLDESGEPLFRMGERGVERKIVKRDKKTGAVIAIWWKWICSPLELIAETRDGDDSNWGKLFRFQKIQMVKKRTGCF